MKKGLFILIISCLFYQTSFSTHYMGGEITWECLPNGNYRFLMKLYRECYTNGGTAATFGSTESITSNSPAGTISMAKKTGWPIDISPTCNQSSGLNHIACVGMSPMQPNMGAVQEYSYTSDVSFPVGVALTGVPPVTGWMFYNQSCCRNPCTNITGASSLGYRLRAIMYPFNNQNTSICFDNSPQFSERPITAICNAQPFTYNHFATDIDYGDSTSYSWGQILHDNGSVIISYSSGYSFGNPYPDQTFNSLNVPAFLNPYTGQINLTSFTTGSFVSSVKVTTYRQGIKIAEIWRDMQVAILGCGTNSSPLITPPFKDNQGNYTQFSDTVIVGDSVLTSISITDTGFLSNGSPQKILTYFNGSIFGNIIPNSNPPVVSQNSGCLLPPCASLNPAPVSFSSPLISQNQIVTQFFWKTDCNHLSGNQTEASYHFVVNALDDYCPLPGQNIKTISIVVKDKPAVEPPDLDSFFLATSGSVDLFWNPPVDTQNSFKAFVVYRALGKYHPYQILDTLYGINQLHYHDASANAMQNGKCYYLRSLYGCNNNSSQNTSDTLCIGSNFIGIQEVKHLNQITCIPNPTSGKFQISYYSTVSGEIELKISDITGKQIQTGKYNSKTGENTIQLDLSEMINGIYFISLKIDNESVTKKIIIQK